MLCWEWGWGRPLQVLSDYFLLFGRSRHEVWPGRRKVWQGKGLWRSLQTILGAGCTLPCDHYGAHNFSFHPFRFCIPPSKTHFRKSWRERSAQWNNSYGEWQDFFPPFWHIQMFVMRCLPIKSSQCLLTSALYGQPYAITRPRYRNRCCNSPALSHAVVHISTCFLAQPVLLKAAAVSRAAPKPKKSWHGAKRGPGAPHTWPTFSPFPRSALGHASCLPFVNAFFKYYFVLLARRRSCSNQLALPLPFDCSIDCAPHALRLLLLLALLHHWSWLPWPLGGKVWQLQDPDANFFRQWPVGVSLSPCLAFPLAMKPALCQCGVCRMEKLSRKYIRASRGEAGRKTRSELACEKGDTNPSLTRDLPKKPLPQPLHRGCLPCGGPSTKLGPEHGWWLCGMHGDGDWEHRAINGL